MLWPEARRSPSVGIAGPLTIPIAQTTLIRLVLGAFPPEDLLSRAEPQLDEHARACLTTLFPQRQPYMYPLDR